ncbi:bifunctional glyoxylate/hydroxypyruvate reductase B [Stutzerimonas stutzeri]|uniref:Bifunctional glyoxylate/hydroxypyruvate reductase B n=1 Tax=Stutzerimonas stutzeri TaxID=316 RepID=W8RZH2_STUST|nr:D-glycerate dehydrogenase [Stutzerimonas stutzeri]AHL77511.1 bifunctional glyoxylate/hydroxypyruvate reductase B [Stutzerimonas stutzeri]MCQ4330409.1 D-glycerate dehydrogenase [Stutzerimonas stutzeri]
MHKKRIVALRRLKASHLQRLREAFEVDYFEEPEQQPEAVASALRQAHGLIGGKLLVTPALLDEAPLLEAIATISVGYDNLPVAELSRRGILLTNTPDVLTETTADTGFMLIMASARRLVELANMVREGRWTQHVGEPHFGSNVHGKTLGLVGLGRIGRAIARRALGFDMRVLYSNASPKPELEAEWGLERRSFEQLLAESDFICLTVPLTEQTEHLLGYEQCRLMKRSAFLINIARGRVVDEAGLIRALEEGLIAGAGLDVFEREPVAADSPLLRMDNVVTLPHIGSATHETREAMANCAVENICQALSGHRPRDLVNPEARPSGFSALQQERSVDAQ